MKASDISYNSKEKYIEATIEKVKVQIYTAKLPVDADIDTSNV